MTKVFVLAVVAVIAGALAPGCAVEAPAGQHGFSRAVDGTVLPASPADTFAPAQAFERAEREDAPAAATGAETLEPDGTCSGSCSETRCSCTGTLSCCIAGCVACWEVLDAQ